jgi:hypothetical protein
MLLKQFHAWLGGLGHGQKLEKVLSISLQKHKQGMLSFQCCQDRPGQLQQQMRLVGTQCFNPNANLHPFVSKHDGKLGTLASCIMKVEF